MSFNATANTTYRIKIDGVYMPAISSGTYRLTVGYVRTAPDLVAPANVIATRAFASQINVQWDDNNTTESGYKVVRSTAGSPWQDIGVVSANTTLFTDTKVEAGKTYAYRVVAFNNQGDSPFSTAAIVSTVVTSEFSIQFEFGGAVSGGDQTHFFTSGAPLV